MPVLDLDLFAPVVVVQCADCKRNRSLLCTELRLGTPMMLDAIVLPPCVCGALEVLIRTWDVTPRRIYHSAFGEQRRRVNALAIWLKREGLLSDTAREQHLHPPQGPFSDPPEYDQEALQ